jgi:hypothetical protein
LGRFKDDGEQLSIEYDNSVSKLVSSKGVGRVGSLDPTNFQLWDKQVEDATVVSEIDAGVLSNALDYAKRFVSDQETKSPNQCLVEIRNGLMHSTDTVGFSIVEADGFDKLGLRIHGKDIPALLLFLGQFNGEKIEVLDHDKCQMFRHGDALIGITKWPYPFPSLKLNREDKARTTIHVNPASLREAIQYVSTFAQKTDKTVYFSVDGDQLVVGAASASGIGDKDTSPVPILKSEGLDVFVSEKPDGFRLSRDHINKVLASFGSSENEVVLGVGWSPKNGFVRLRRKADGVDYFTAVVWSK